MSSASCSSVCMRACVVDVMAEDSANYTCQIDGPLNTVMAAVTHSVVVISQHSRSVSSLPVFAQNESAPKIIINDTIVFFSLKLQSTFWLFQTITFSEYRLIKLLPYILFEKYIHIFALQMACPRNRHCANCIGTLSFPIAADISCRCFVARPRLSITMSVNIHAMLAGFVTLPQLDQRSTANSASVCLSVSCISRTKCQNFTNCCLWLWLCPPLESLRYAECI